MVAYFIEKVAFNNGSGQFTVISVSWTLVFTVLNAAVYYVVYAAFYQRVAAPAVTALFVFYPIFLALFVLTIFFVYAPVTLFAMLDAFSYYKVANFFFFVFFFLYFFLIGAIVKSRLKTPVFYNFA